MARVSVLIVTYESSESITAVLESLNRQAYRDFDVVLVDNASKDETKARVETFKAVSTYPLTTVYLEENRGFAGGNNIAFSHARGEYIALLNPDARAAEMWLQELTENLDRDTKAGICASRVLTWDGSAIDSAGDILLSTLRVFKRESPHNSRYKQREYVFSACAAAAMYRREMIDKIGFFDEDFFLQCEDTDLSMRAQIAGWKILYLPEAVVYHEVGHSIGRASATGIYYSQRNMEFLRMKYLPASLLLKNLPQMLFGFTADLIYFGLRQKKPGVFLRAKFDALKMAGLMLKKRKDLSNSIKAVDNTYLRSLVTPLFMNKSLIKMKLVKLTPVSWSERQRAPQSQSKRFLSRIFSIAKR
ncbi:MAG: glycosyltransferase family 2 protein [Thermodesulfobacteriota bacterium]